MAFKDRTGEVNRATNGMLMRIEIYRNNHDIDVLFEDGTLVKNKIYKHFLSGKIKYPVESFSSLCKRYGVNYAHALNYRKQHTELSDIDAIKRVEELDRLAKEALKRKGEVARAKNGLLMTIIEYRRCDDIDIQFEDGEIVKNKQYDNFKRGQIKHPFINTQLTDKTNEVMLQNCGQYAKVIRYGNTDDIDIQFTDGTILNNKKYKAFKHGQYRNPKYHRVVEKICKEYGITFNEFYAKKCRNIELSDTEIIEQLLSDTTSITYVKMQCKLNDISYKAVKTYIDRHPSESYEEIINYYLGIKDTSKVNKLRIYCKENDINYDDAVTYKKRHPELTDEDVVVHYRPECYVNWLGELVIPEDTDNE